MAIFLVLRVLTKSQKSEMLVFSHLLSSISALLGCIDGGSRVQQINLVYERLSIVVSFSSIFLHMQYRLNTKYYAGHPLFVLVSYQFYAYFKLFHFFDNLFDHIDFYFRILKNKAN